MGENDAGVGAGKGNPTVQMLLYFAAFAVPTAVVAVVLPAYAPYIMMIGILLLFAVTSFLIGLHWSDSGWTPTARSAVTNGLIWFIVVIPVASFFMRQPRNVVGLIVELAVFAAATMPWFYLGKSIGRWRSRGVGVNR